MTQRLNTKAVALALGLMWSLGVLFMSMTALATESYLHNMVDFIASVYLGYSLSFGGIITGMVWDFLMLRLVALSLPGSTINLIRCLLRCQNSDSKKPGDSLDFFNFSISIDFFAA